MKRRVLMMMMVAFLGMTTVNAQTLRGSNGQSIGRIDRDGTIRGSNGQSIGRYDNNGTVRGSNGQTIGKVERDGTIRDANGRSIGKAQNCDPKQAAASFFFYK